MRNGEKFKSVLDGQDAFDRHDIVMQVKLCIMYLNI